MNDNHVHEQVYLPYSHWVLVLDAIDCAREDTLKAAANPKTGAASRKALSVASDLYTLIGESVSGQLEPGPDPGGGIDASSGFDLSQPIPDPRDTAATPLNGRKPRRKAVDAV